MLSTLRVQVVYLKGASCLPDKLQAVYLKGGAVECPKHVMLGCQGDIGGYMHQLPGPQQRASSLRCLAHCFGIRVACTSWLLLLGVLVCTLGHEADCPCFFIIIIIIVICLWGQMPNEV